MDLAAALITGTVVAGPDPACVLLSSAGRTYQLLQVRTRPPLGARLRVIGTVQRDVRPACRAIPLRVRDLRPVP